MVLFDLSPLSLSASLSFPSPHHSPTSPRLPSPFIQSLHPSSVPPLLCIETTWSLKRGGRLAASLILINPAWWHGHSRSQALLVYQIEIHNLIEVRALSRQNKSLQPGPARSIVINIWLGSTQLVGREKKTHTCNLHLKLSVKSWQYQTGLSY